MSIRCCKPLPVLILVCAGAVYAQSPVSCSGKVSEEQLLNLVRGNVPESRVLQFIAQCGVGFTWSDNIKSRLTDAKATPAVLAAAESTARRSQADTQPAEVTKPTASGDDIRLRVELALWETAKQHNTIAAYEDYLERFPSGTFANAANAQILKLRGLAKEDTHAPAPSPVSTPAPTADSPRNTGGQPSRVYRPDILAVSSVSVTIDGMKRSGGLIFIHADHLSFKVWGDLPPIPDIEKSNVVSISDGGNGLTGRTLNLKLKDGRTAKFGELIYKLLNGTINSPWVFTDLPNFMGDLDPEMVRTIRQSGVSSCGAPDPMLCMLDQRQPGNRIVFTQRELKEALRRIWGPMPW